MEENTNIKKSAGLKIYTTLVVKVVLGLYGLWVVVVSADYGLCRLNKGWGAAECEPQRTEIRSVFTTITVGLIGWICDSPVSK